MHVFMFIVVMHIDIISYFTNETMREPCFTFFKLFVQTW